MNHPLIDAKMDKQTFTAFNQLWTLYKDHQNIRPDDAAAWDGLVDAASKIVTDSSGTDDPEFISDFAISVLESLDRLSAKNN